MLGHPAVTSVERGGAVDVSGDEGGLLLPHGVVPHPPDATLYAGERKGERERGQREGVDKRQRGGAIMRGGRRKRRRKKEGRSESKVREGRTWRRKREKNRGQKRNT